ncbi:MAG: hypothetical protein CMJ46_03785 [Planctomyces sp.]|nr:hypothetical protein [Planctomyces sp.]
MSRGAQRPFLRHAPVLFVATFCACAVLLPGCWQGDPVTPTTNTTVATSPAPTPEKPVESDPEQSLRHLIENFQTDPELVWEALPASYQESLQSQQQLFARKIDPLAWEKVNRLLAELGVLFEKHQEDILAAQGEEPLPMLGQMNETQLEYLQGLFTALSSPPFQELEQLKERPFEELWLALASALFQPDITQGAGGESALPQTPILTDYFDRLSRVEVSLVSREGDKAVLKLVDPQVPDEPQEVEFVLTEGKWIPVRWKEAWPLWMGQAKLTLDMAANYLNGFVLMQTRLLTDLENRLQDLNQIEDSAEFATAWQSAMEEVKARLPMPTTSTAANDDATAPPAKPLSEIDVNAQAMIVLDRALTETEQEQYSERILDLCQYPDAAVLLPPEVAEQETRFRLMPVPDLKAVANAVDFGVVQEVDTDQQQIRISLPAESAE